MSRSLYLTAFFALALFVFGACADARAQSSYTGSKEGFVGSKAKKPVVPLEDMSEDEFNDEMERTKPRLPPVFESVKTPTALNNDGTAAATAEDPCAAYLGNFDGYTICQDRMQKIQKMQDGKKTRKEMYGTQQKTRASEQRRIDAEKAAADAAAAAEKAAIEAAKTDEEKAADAAKAAAEAAAAAEANREKTPTEKYIEQKAERLKPKSIGK